MKTLIVILMKKCPRMKMNEFITCNSSSVYKVSELPFDVGPSSTAPSKGEFDYKNFKFDNVLLKTKYIAKIFPFFTNFLGMISH